MAKEKTDYELNNLVEPTKTQTSVAAAFGYSAQEVAVIQNVVAKNTTKTELAYFINVCKSVGLNPFIKEIWCYKDNKGNLIVFAGRDGFLTKAQKSPSYNGIRSSEICENDEWAIDIPNGKVKHLITKPKKERGKILGAYCFVYRKDGEPTLEWSEFETYNKSKNTWASHPASMIKKVAETSALKKAFGISGIQSEHEWNKSGDTVVPINAVEEKPTEVIVKEKKEKIKKTPRKTIELP